VDAPGEVYANGLPNYPGQKHGCPDCFSACRQGPVNRHGDSGIAISSGFLEKKKQLVHQAGGMTGKPTPGDSCQAFHHPLYDAKES
jgi:hypothetical protein